MPVGVSKYRNWFWAAALTILGISIVAVFVVAASHIKEVRHLQGAANKIQIGDSPKEVHLILGEAKLGYESGWPGPGAPPTEYGELYGGRLDHLRNDFASFANRTLAGVSPYSFSRGSIRSWPVLVIYNGSKRVSAVYIGCIKVK